MRFWTFAIVLSQFFIIARAGQTISVKQASRIVIPIFIAGEADAVAIAKISQVSKEFRRKGFFRVALLPYMSLSDVQIEFRRPVSASRVVSELGFAVERLFGSKSFEISGVKLILPGDKPISIRAKSLRLEDGPRCVLTSVDLRTGSHHYSADRASISFAQPHSAKLTLVANGATIELPVFP